MIREGSHACITEIMFKGSIFPQIKQTNKHLKVHEPMT